jgi:phosphopantetheinyl transferase (holo-ACP synthase)
LIGTDVIDLSDPEAAESALHPRFDARAFAPAERARLEASPERSVLRWVLWAAKEATYKAASGSAGARPFHPAEIEARLAPARGGVFEGGATLGGAFFRVRVEVGGGAVRALAAAQALAPRQVLGALRPLSDPSADGASARALALDLASAALGVPRSELSVSRRGRLPELRRGAAPLDACLSLSHHGRFVAAALALPAAPVGRAS